MRNMQTIVILTKRKLELSKIKKRSRLKYYMECDGFFDACVFVGLRQENPQSEDSQKRSTENSEDSQCSLQYVAQLLSYVNQNYGEHAEEYRCGSSDSSFRRHLSNRYTCYKSMQADNDTTMRSL